MVGQNVLPLRTYVPGATPETFVNSSEDKT